MPGSYKAYVGDIVLTKPVTIRGAKRYARPLVNVTFTAAAGASAVSLIDLDLDGTGITNASLLTVSGASSIYNDILISGCRVHDYSRLYLPMPQYKSKICCRRPSSCPPGLPLSCDFVAFSPMLCPLFFPPTFPPVPPLVLLFGLLCLPATPGVPRPVSLRPSSCKCPLYKVSPPPPPRRLSLVSCLLTRPPSFAEPETPAFLPTGATRPGCRALILALPQGLWTHAPSYNVLRAFRPSTFTMCSR